MSWEEPRGAQRRHTPCDRCGKLHERCAGHTRDGKPCQIWPIKGTSVCRLHGGAAPQTLAKAKKRQAIDEIRRIVSLGGSLDVAPTDAMLDAVREAAWNVATYRVLVQALTSDLAEDYDLDLDAATGFTSLSNALAVRIKPDELRAEAHVFVRMYDQERDRLVKYAKLCRDAGVEEAKVRIAEEQGQWLARTIDAVFAKLELTPEQLDRLPAVMLDVIGELEQQAGGA